MTFKPWIRAVALYANLQINRQSASGLDPEDECRHYMPQI